MSFAFVCHHSTFIVYNSTKKANDHRWKIISRSSVGIALILCLTLSVDGFLSFRDGVEADILNNFSYENTAINVARVLLAMTMVFTFPMEQFVARHCAMELLEAWGFVRETNRWIYFYVVTMCLWTSSLCLGAFMKDLGPVLELDGALGASLLGYVMPVSVFLFSPICVSTSRGVMDVQDFDDKWCDFSTATSSCGIGSTVVLCEGPSESQFF